MNTVSATDLLLSVIVLALYLVGAVLQWRSLKLGDTSRRNIIVLLGAIALLIQIWLGLDVLIMQEGFNLGLYSTLNIISIVLVVIALVSAVGYSLDHALIFVYPFAALASMLSHALGSGFSATIISNPGLAAHVVLSMLSYAVLVMAGVQAALLILQDKHLKEKQVDSLIKTLPPLQTMDQLLLLMTLVGTLLLTFALLIGFNQMGDMFQQKLAHKTVLSLISWLLFFGLLIGRKALGWRGKLAAKWTLVALGILALGYLGSKLVLEFIVIA